MYSLHQDTKNSLHNLYYPAGSKANKRNCRNRRIGPFRFKEIEEREKKYGISKKWWNWENRAIEAEYRFLFSSAGALSPWATLCTRVRVRGDILPVIKKRLVKTSRGSLFLSSREAGVYVLIFLYYNIVPAAHLLEIKLFPAPWPVARPPYTSHLRPSVPPGTKLTRTQHTRLPPSL